MQNTIIAPELVTLLNYRIQQEELSSRIYLAMSTWLNINGYTGASTLWKAYSDEERSHAEWSYKYLLDLNILPTVPALDRPVGVFKSLPDIIIKSYEHEVDITEQCQQLARTAQQLGDYMTLDLAQKFLREQVDELAKTNYWIDRLQAFGGEPAALRLLDDEMKNH